jgi:hypothetical protein
MTVFGQDCSLNFVGAPILMYQIYDFPNMVKGFQTNLGIFYPRGVLMAHRFLNICFCVLNIRMLKVR